MIRDLQIAQVDEQGKDLLSEELVCGATVCVEDKPDLKFWPKKLRVQRNQNFGKDTSSRPTRGIDDAPSAGMPKRGRPKGLCEARLR